MVSMPTIQGIKSLVLDAAQQAKSRISTQGLELVKVGCIKTKRIIVSSSKVLIKTIAFAATADITKKTLNTAWGFSKSVGEKALASRTTRNLGKVALIGTVSSFLGTNAAVLGFVKNAGIVGLATVATAGTVYLTAKFGKKVMTASLTQKAVKMSKSAALALTKKTVLTLKKVATSKTTRNVITGGCRLTYKLATSSPTKKAIAISWSIVKGTLSTAKTLATSKAARTVITGGYKLTRAIITSTATKKLLKLTGKLTKGIFTATATAMTSTLAQQSIKMGFKATKSTVEVSALALKNLFLATKWIITV